MWSQFRRWSRNGTWALALTMLHAAARLEDGRTVEKPSMVVIDTHLARGASNGGFTFHDRGGPYGRTKGAKRVVAVDVTGLPVAALVVAASTHENRASELMLEHLARQGVTDRLELVLVDRGVTAAAARTLGRDHDTEVRRVGWDDKQPVFRPIRQGTWATARNPAPDVRRTDRTRPKRASTLLDAKPEERPWTALKCDARNSEVVGLQDEAMAFVKCDGRSVAGVGEVPDLTGSFRERSDALFR